MLDVHGGILESDRQIIQYKRKMLEDAQNQRWYYREDGVIYPQVDPNLVLDIRVSFGNFLFFWDVKRVLKKSYIG